MSDQRDRAGKFFLKPRGKNGIYQICWYDSTTGQIARTTTGTADIEAARTALYKHALEHAQPINGTDAQLAAVMQSYYIHYAQHLPSAHCQRAAQADALEIWGDPNVSDLKRTKQLELVVALRARNLSDWTIDSRLNRIWAAMNWHKRDHAEFVVPEQITAEDWKPVLEDRDHVYSLEELASLLDAAAEPPIDIRYTREHWWRFLVLAIGTASREAALRELKWDEVDLRVGRIKLNPPGRRQTKKRRPTVPIAPTLAAELASWSHDGEQVVTYYGRGLATREFYDLLAERAGVTGGPNVIRHTVRTWLAEYGVPDSEADIFMGHRPEGTATSRRYIHRRPEYLRSVTEGIEALFQALGSMIRRPFKGQELVDQPKPEDPDFWPPLATYLPTALTGLRNYLNLERETRLELATPTLARQCYPYNNNDLEGHKGTVDDTQIKGLPS